MGRQKRLYWASYARTFQAYPANHLSAQSPHFSFLLQNFNSPLLAFSPSRSLPTALASLWARPKNAQEPESPKEFPKEPGKLNSGCPIRRRCPGIGGAPSPRVKVTSCQGPDFFLGNISGLRIRDGAPSLGSTTFWPWDLR